MFETTLKVDGMKCGMCESHVNDIVRKAVDVKKVSSSHSKGVTVVISETQPDEEAIKNAITAQGYRVTSVETRQYEKRGLFGRRK